MDQEFENIQALEQAFEDEVTGELPDTAEVQQQLNTVLAATTELNTIEQAVKQEGVSQEDMEQVFTVIKRLSDAGIEVGVSPSMEEFGVLHYTPTRSIVNHSLGLESIGGTILNVIKIVLEKLIAFAAGIVKAYRIFTNSNKSNDLAFETARKKSKDVQEFIHLLKRTAMVSVEDIDNQVIEFAKSELASNRKIPRSSVGLAALMHKDEQEWIRHLYRDAEKHTRLLRMAVRGVNQVVGLGASTVSIDLDLFKNLDSLRDLIDKAKTEDPKEDFITSQIDYQVLLDSTIRKQMEPIVKYEYVVKAFYDVAGDLRALKRFKPDGSDPDFNNTLVELLSYLTKGLEDLDLIVRFFAYVKQVQLQVCRVQLRILNRHASLLYQRVLDTTPHELSKAKAEQAFDRLGKKLRTYGI